MAQTWRLLHEHVSLSEALIAFRQHVHIRIPSPLPPLLQIIPLVAFEGVFDAVNICGSGVFRGCGKQMTGFLLNFVAYYVIGLPLGFFMVCNSFLSGSVCEGGSLVRSMFSFTS